MSRKQGPHRKMGMRPAAIAAGSRQCNVEHRDAGAEATAA